MREMRCLAQTDTHVHTRLRLVVVRYSDISLNFVALSSHSLSTSDKPPLAYDLLDKAGWKMQQLNKKV